MTTSQSGRPAILVVEDEHLVRMYATAILEEAGFEVIEAPNADEAVSFLESRKDIRIVFTDIDMPGSIDGLRLAKAIRERWPPIELILTSGKYDLPNIWLPERGKFLRKPYRAAALVGVINEFAIR